MPSAAIFAPILLPRCSFGLFTDTTEREHMQRPRHRKIPGRLRGLAVVPVFLAISAIPASAERIENDVAIFAALDKVTAQVQRIPMELNKTYQFGSLKITPRVCYSRPPTEQPKTTTFVEVDEVMLNGQEQRIFTGWMFAESPGLNAVEHPVYDIWLTGCANPRSTVSQRDGRPEGEPNQGAFEVPRRRVRR